VCYFFRLVQDWLPMGGPGGRLHEQWVDLDYRAVRPWELRPCQPAVFLWLILPATRCDDVFVRYGEKNRTKLPGNQPRQ